jgi:LCP family protein required for cell wall assembly
MGTPRPGKRGVLFSRVKRRFLKHVWLARIGVLTGVLVGSYLLFALIALLFQNTGITNYPVLAYNFIFTPASKIKSIDSRVNIIILGKSGPGHAGADLTDTIMLASVSLSRPSVVLISIPRDIWIPEIRAKINTAYYWGNQKEPNGGLIMAKSEAEEVVGEPVQYGIVVDFEGFKKIIDTLGGVDVAVERSFTDSKYPIPGRENDTCGEDKEFKCRYETVTFTQGVNHMDGETALKFVRSRNAPGDEGTDLARAARQEKVISATKDKFFTPQALVDIKKNMAIFNILQESVETDINADAATILGRRILEAKNKINSSVIPESLLENPPISARYDYQYVFIPKGGAWKGVHDWVSQLLEGK